MSHFVVVVIGDDVEGQLAPYQENNMGNCPQEYLEFQETDEDFEEDYEEYLRDNEGEEDLLTYEEFICEEFGYKLHEGKIGYWENPNKKWDWWVVGGRWRGYFPVKPGVDASLGDYSSYDRVFGAQDIESNRADQLKVEDLDLKRAMAEAELQARVAFDKWRTVYELHGKPDSWNTCYNQHKPDHDAARKAYNSQPAIEAYKKHVGFFFDCPVDTIGFDEEAYVSRQRLQSIVPYAFVKDGKWVAKGDMGWWGMSNDHESQDDWNAKFYEMLNSLPPETQLTAVDCHI